MSSWKERFGPWALVTGASSGIGEEIARQLAAEGLHLVLTARRKPLLEELAGELSAEYGIDTQVVDVDLCAPGFLETLRAATAGREIGLLVNNAGVGALGSFLEAGRADLESIIALNSTAPTVLSHAFGSDMASRGRGGILIVSSMVAFMGAPQMWNYPATKAYDLLLGEALNYELGQHGVSVSTLAPGFTAPGFTDYVDVSRVPMPIAKTPKVVRKALRGLGRRSLIVPGFMNAMMVRMSGVMPRSWMTRMLGMINARLSWRDAPVRP